MGNLGACVERAEVIGESRYIRKQKIRGARRSDYSLGASRSNFDQTRREEFTLQRHRKPAQSLESRPRRSKFVRKTVASPTRCGIRGVFRRRSQQTNKHTRNPPARPETTASIAQLRAQSARDLYPR